MQRLIISALLLMLLASCGSKQNTVQHKATEVGHIREMRMGFPGTGLYYSLPRTVIAIDVEVRRSESIPGPYASFAERYLGLHNVIREQDVKYQITGVDISSHAEPDPEQVFFVTLPDHRSKSMYVALNENGIIRSVNVEQADESLQKQKIGSKDMHYMSGDATFNYFIDTNLMERIDTIIEHVQEDTITLQRQTLRRSWVEKSQELRAREVADYILEIREKKFDLITGFQEITYSRETLEYMYTELNKLEQDYLNLFTGITRNETIRYRFLHTPGFDDEDQKLLFCFSTDSGISGANEDKGTPVWLHYARSNTTKQLGEQIRANAMEGHLTRKGFHYRIPEHADLKLKIGETTRASARVLVSQFGIVTYLPSTDMEIRFDPKTGSLKSIGIEKIEETEEK